MKSQDIYTSKIIQREQIKQQMLREREIKLNPRGAVLTAAQMTRRGRKQARILINSTVIPS
jgi:hypothetical protein